MSLPPRITLNRTARPVREPDPRKDRDHLKALHDLICVVCGRWPVVVHHLLRVDGHSRGMGYKNGDKWGLPMCENCHQSLHDDGAEEVWLALNGIDGRAVCRALCRVTGDHEAMVRIVERARQKGA